MAENDRFNAMNRAYWEEVVPIHAASDFYDVAAFKAGRCTLKPIEIDEMGDVEGRSLLHLQCHFGLDTLSWARRGAQVTGLDLSAAAIDQARSLAREAGIDARFVHSNVYEAPAALSGESFDIVYTAWGVLGWLDSIELWAAAVAGTLAPGGRFYIVEQHPLIHTYDDVSGDKTAAPRIAYPYFGRTDGETYTDPGTYADRTADVKNTTQAFWMVTLGEIVSALARKGLRVEFLHEHPFICWPGLPVLEGPDGDGYWRWPRRGDGTRLEMPLAFSLMATKPV